MEKCLNCGKRGWRLQTLDCPICGKEGCDECFIFLFQIVDGTKPLDIWYACSDKCRDDLVKEIESQISSSDIPVDRWDQIPPIHLVAERAVLKEDSTRVFPEVIKELKKGKQLHLYFAKGQVPLSLSDGIGEREDKALFKSNPLWQRLYQYTRLLQAKQFETLREYENAAKVYRSLGKYEEAVRMTDKQDEIARTQRIAQNARRTLPKSDQIVKEKEVIVKIRCPYCHSLYDETLNKCPHCGAKR